MLLVAVVGTACADVTTSAIEVNGESIGRGELTDLIVDLRSPAVDEDPVAVDCVARDTAVEVTVLTALVRQELERRGAKRGMISLCVGGGMGISTIIERL